MKVIKEYFCSVWKLAVLLLMASCANSISYSTLGKGWSSNSINTVKFRQNALTTYGNFQFTAYYDEESYLVLGKRKSNETKWIIRKTPYKGNTSDAHNNISIAIDGKGFLHVAWDHHDTQLRYAVSDSALGLNLGLERSMTGAQETKVTYPQFYNLSNGNLLFLYRSGASGRGNLVVNSYDLTTGTWNQIQNNLIDGENARSAYWQACVDGLGTIHMSWVWRETWDVETNHDLCYARSKDGGKTWESSKGIKYNLPITLQTAEKIWDIPEHSNLINQTSISADIYGNPYTATYFNASNVPQYKIIYKDGDKWKHINTGFRTTKFSLGGGGTKKVPISRPDILIKNAKNITQLFLLFRDEERNNKISLAYSEMGADAPWQIKDLSANSVGEWEPNYDKTLWESKKKLQIFYQDVTQLDGEGLKNRQPTEVKILEINNVDKLIK